MYTEPMSCIPRSGGCERRATDALVAHLNAHEGTRYEHQACLDQIDRTRPQPECRYANVDDGRSLVVERKSISLPESYAYAHSKDHDLADEIGKSLMGVEFRDVFLLRMPAAGGLVKGEVSAVGQYVGEAIRLHYAGLRRGEPLQIRCRGHSFQFGIQPLEDRDDSGPERGLVFSWLLSAASLEPDRAAEMLRSQIENIYAACIRKFADHSESRRILMLDPHGDVQFMDAWWWNRALTNCPPPSGVDEIWIGSNGTDDWGEEEWIIEKVYGGSIKFPAPLPMPSGK